MPRANGDGIERLCGRQESSCRLLLRERSKNGRFASLGRRILEFDQSREAPNGEWLRHISSAHHEQNAEPLRKVVQKPAPWASWDQRMGDFDPRVTD